jgi:hypothetical protein
MADRTANAPAPVLVSVADKRTCCGLPPPLSFTDTAPLKVPRDDDLKVTVMMQDPPAFTVDPQVLVWEKVLEPVIAMLLMMSVVLAVLVSVVFWGGGGQLLGSLWQWNFRLVGFSVTTVPVPLRATFWGLPGALSLIDKVPERVPGCVGLKVTLMVQLVPAARLEPQVFAWLKSPLAAMLVISSAIVP